MDTIKIDKRNVKLIAHRGVSGIERENTNAAFVAAGNRSYFGIETDVHKTADGQYVIIHDDVTGRVANENISVEQNDLATLRSLKLSDLDGEFRDDLILPTLDEYVKICKRYEKVCVLELKNAFSKEEVYEIIDIIVKRDYLENVIFISFNLDNLLYVKEKYPEQPAMFLCGVIPDETIAILVEKKIDIDINYLQLLGAEGYCAKLKAAGLQVNAWTCDLVADAERLIEAGVDYITTDILE